MTMMMAIHFYLLIPPHWMMAYYMILRDASHRRHSNFPRRMMSWIFFLVNTLRDLLSSYTQQQTVHVRVHLMDILELIFYIMLRTFQHIMLRIVVPYRCIVFVFGFLDTLDSDQPTECRENKPQFETYVSQKGRQSHHHHIHLLVSVSGHL